MTRFAKIGVISGTSSLALTRAMKTTGPFAAALFLLAATTAIAAPKPSPTPAPTASPSPSPGVKPSPSVTASPSATANSSPTSTPRTGQTKKLPAPLVDPDGTWILNANGNWSNTANWAAGIIADGGGFANFSTIDITTNVNVTIDNNTSRTVRRIDIGDTNATHSYKIQSSGSTTLIFDNTANNANAQLNQTSGSAGDSITAPIVLNSSLDITNAAAATLLLSTGGITSGTMGTKTITGSTGPVTISGVIGDGNGVVGITQNGPGTLTLSGNNTFTGGLTIRGGTVSATTNANALGGTGSGIVTLGDTSGSASATLLGSQFTFPNPITVASGSSGTLTIGNSGNSSATFSGPVMLNNNLTLTASGSGSVKLSGGVTGTGNIILNHTGTGNSTFLDTTLVNNTGTITNSGTGTGTATINSKLGASVTQVAQESPTSVLILSMTTNNAFVGSVAVNAGTLKLGSASALNSANVVSVAAGATFDINAQNQTIAGLDGGTGTVTNSGGTHTLTLGGSGNYTFGGVITATNTLDMIIVKSGSGTQTLTGASTYSNTTTVNGGFLFANNTTGSGTGTGAVTVNNSGTTLGGNGTITGSVSVTSGANLSPGATGVGSTARLNTGALTLSSGSFFNVDLNNATAGTGYDQVSVTGLLSITSSNLNINPGAGLSIGNTLFIALNNGTDAITGTFAGLAQGATVTSGAYSFTIDYFANGDLGTVGNDIALTVTAAPIPEPGTWIGGALALGAIALASRRKVRALL